MPGVGPKTAAKWLEMYDGLENLTMHAGELKGKAAEAFQERIEDVLRNRQINALVRDLELPLSIEDLLRRPGTGRPPTSSSTVWSSGCCGIGCWRRCPTRTRSSRRAASISRPRACCPASLAGWLDEHATGERTGVDVIGHWGSGRGDISALALAAGGGPRRTSTPPSCNSADETALVDWLADPARHKAMHDAKGPLLAIWARGWDLAGLTSDTQLAAYLTRPDQRTFDLADLTIRYLKRELKVEGTPS